MEAKFNMEKGKKISEHCFAPLVTNLSMSFLVPRTDTKISMRKNDDKIV